MKGEHTITVEVELDISDQELIEADGSVEQAAQNRLGHTAATVVSVIDAADLAT